MALEQHQVTALRQVNQPLGGGGGFGGAGLGFSEAANNRRLELQLRYSF